MKFFWKSNNPNYDQMPASDSTSKSTMSSIIKRITRPHEIKSFRPNTYEAVTEIADHLLRNQTAIVDLKVIDPSRFYRALDFISGVCYAEHGNIEKVGDKLYLVTPKSVEVSAELKKTLSIGLDSLDN